jgi:hypothetical protein
LIEFAFAALVFVVILLATIEFGVEMFAKGVTDRLTNRAAEVYALTRDATLIEEVFANRADLLTQRCLEEPVIVLFDSVASTDVLFAAGRSPTGTSADDTAVAFRLEVRCVWPRLTPALGGLLGTVGGHNSVIALRFRDGV